LNFQPNKSPSPDEGVEEDEDVEREITNGHAESNQVVQNTTQKCGKYAYAIIFLLY
jgi:hypothetical protein